MENFFGGLEKRQEKFLQHLFKKINKVFDLRLNPKEASKIYTVPILTQDQKRDLSYVAAIQFMRTKEFRQFLTETSQATIPLISPILENEIIDRINQFNPKLDEDSFNYLKSLILAKCNSNLLDVYDHRLSVIHANFLSERYEPVAEIFYNHIWMIGINTIDQPLFTSDHPVVLHAHKSSNGIASEGVEIAFPLNSKLILIMKEKQYFHRDKERESRLFRLTLQDIEHYNRLQIYDSYRFVFCAEDQFDLVRSICQEHPEVCSKSRNRVQVRVAEPTDD